MLKEQKNNYAMKYLLLGGVITLVVVVVDLVVVIIGWCDVGECDDECEVGVVVVSPDSVGCVWGVVVGEGGTIDWSKKMFLLNYLLQWQNNIFTK